IWLGDGACAEAGMGMPCTSPTASSIAAARTGRRRGEQNRTMFANDISKAVIMIKDRSALLPAAAGN
ncbi:hypothetical protein, partial [Serratia marcescens]|uniref:hypothetical protein n=1 Tax=Serratia marcescens TaxID=615 RepID=UPI001954F948